MTPAGPDRFHSDDGSSIVEVAVLFAAFFAFFVMLPWTAASWWYGRQSADMAAEQAVNVGIRTGASDDDIAGAVNAVLGQAQSLRAPAMNIRRDPDRLTITVSGNTSPFGWPVTVVHSAPLEQFRPRTSR